MTTIATKRITSKSTTTTMKKTMTASGDGRNS